VSSSRTACSAGRDVHIVSAYEPGGRAVARYIACTTQDGFSIEEVRV
jgi:hypothetical protein